MASRNANNRKRGVAFESDVAKLLGGRKVGQLNLPWDVEVDGYMRVQCKKLVRWPSFGSVIGWMDAIPVGPHMRAVVIEDAPGRGFRSRRLLVLDLDEFLEHHGS